MWTARSLSISIYNVLIGETPVQRAITLTDRVGLDLLPSTTDLAGAEVEMAQMMARERLLERALRPLLGVYDYILIDEPPSLGLLTINGLTAAQNGVIIPVQCEYLAMEGLSLLLQTIRQVRDILNERLVIAGVVLTMYDAAHQACRRKSSARCDNTSPASPSARSSPAACA